MTYLPTAFNVRCTKHKIYKHIHYAWIMDSNLYFCFTVRSQYYRVEFSDGSLRKKSSLRVNLQFNPTWQPKKVIINNYNIYIYI